MLPDDETSFIWSALGSGTTDSPAKALDRLYERFVGRYDEKSVSRRDDAAVWKPVRDRLAQYEIEDRLQPKTISSSVDSVEFDHCWKNGLWHCYQPLSFDLASADTIRDKAHRWAGQLTGLTHASETFKPFFFVGLPSDEALVPAYQAAMDILRLSPGRPEVIEETELDAFVSQIEVDVRSHQVSEVPDD